MYKRQAFDHASKVDNLDFLALTDHSNLFDNDANVHLDSENAEELSEEWKEGRSGARNITERENGTFVGLYGFEMTWSGGAPGHINTCLLYTSSVVCFSRGRRRIGCHKG